MAIVVKDRVRESSSAVTPAGFTLAGAPLGFQPFSVLGDGSMTYYVAANTTTGAWEVGVATYRSTGNLLERYTTFDSSDGGAPVTFPNGQADLYCTYPADRAVYVNETGWLVDLNGVNLTAGSIIAVYGFEGGGYNITGLNADNISSGVLGVVNGGTGADNQPDAITNLAGPQAAGYYLRSDGIVTELSPLDAGDLINEVTIEHGGTGAADQQTAINTLTGVQVAGYYLRSDGTDATLSAIQAADVPTLNQNTTGTAANVSGVVAVDHGGTGATTYTAAINALAGTQTNRTFLRSDGTNVSLSAIQAADVPTLNQNTTGTAANVSGVVAVDHGGTGATTYTDGQLLIGNSTGNTLTRANLSAGTGVAITNGAGAITVDVKISSTYASFVGTLTVFTGTLRWYPRTTITLTSVSVSVSTAPTTATAVFNVRKNGTALFSGTKPSITIGAYTSTPVALSTSLTSSDYLTVDVEIPGGAADAVLRIDYS